MTVERASFITIAADEADPLSMVTSMSKMLQSSIHETKQLEQR